MAAPAGLIMAKIMIPEQEEIEEKEFVMEKDDRSVNVVDAAARGASDGLQLALNVGAMLLAFIALIALANGVLGGIGGWFGAENITIQGILGYIFAPLAFAIGVPWVEAVQAGSYIGQKLVLNEFVAYTAFAPEIANLSPKRSSSSVSHFVDSLTSAHSPSFSAVSVQWHQAAARKSRALACVPLQPVCLRRF